jgi:cytochrome P450
MSDATVELNDDFYQDPHSVYRVLRERGPVHHVRLPEGILGWLILDYDLAKQILADTSAISKDLQTDMCRRAVAKGNYSHADLPVFRGNMLISDPPQHTRLRKLINKAFSSPAIRRLRPRIIEIADGLLDNLRTVESTDLISSYAFPLPIIVLSELLGIPAQDRNDFRSWSSILTTDTSTPAQLGRACAECTIYFDKLIAQRAAEPGADLLSELISASEDGTRLSHTELIGTIVLLIIAGHETTVSLIASAAAELLTDQDSLDQVRSEPDRIPAFVEEALRWQGPFHMATLRYTTKPMQLAGHDIEPGELMLVSLTAANLDPHQFDAPECFQADRQPNRHIGFGAGIHFCPGAPLARMEAAIAIDRLLSRYPDLALLSSADELVWRTTSTFRGLVELPVRLQSSAMAHDGNRN